MDVTPKLVRDVEFREQRRGYDQQEVDDFLERVAVAFGQLRDQLDEALERASRAERRVLEEPADEDELRRTLVLATRTAEATQEDARQRAAATIADAEDRAAATLRDAEARVRDELEPLLARRAELERDVEALQAWAAEVRRRLTEDVREHLAWLEGSGTELPPRPEVADVDVPARAPGAEPFDAAEDGRPGDQAGGSGPYAVADGWDPTPPDVRVGERPPAGDHDPDATGAFDTLAGRPIEGSDAATDAAGADEVPTTRGTGTDDPFLAELRRAVDDDAPRGPRDGGADARHEGAAAEGATVGSDSARRHDADDAADPDGGSSVFRRRRAR